MILTGNREPKTKNQKLLIVCPYPEGKAPSQRFRFEQYLPYLKGNGLEVRVASFWTDKQWPAIYGGSSIGYRVVSTVIAFVKRFFLLFSLPHCDTVFIHREATPIGPPWWEWCAAKIFKKRMIYDFDDAVWLPNSSKANEKLVGRLKNHGKTGKIISWCESVFAGNGFLAEYAGRFCDDVRVVPTTIDTGFHCRKSHEPKSHESRVSSREGDSRLTIGWTGTHSTLKQLIPLFPLLEKVHRQHPFRFLLIADVAPERMPDFVEFRKWKKETEIEDLLEIDIGIMPLYDTEWERGKCGFKALQYMALEIPAVVSGVGVNRDIVEDGVNGFVCEKVTGKDPQQYEKWERDLLALLGDRELRSRMGEKGRKRVKEGYSVEVFRGAYLEIFSLEPPYPRPLKGRATSVFLNHHSSREDMESKGKKASDEKGASDPRLFKGSPPHDPHPLKGSQLHGANEYGPSHDPQHEPGELRRGKGSKPHGQSDPLKLSGMHYGASAQIFDNARKLRENMTPAELKLWGYLRTRPMGCKFRAQHPIHKYILDFYCHRKRLSIEIDGAYHTDEGQQEKDQARTDFLKNITITEIRFSNKQVFNHFQEVVEKIENEIS